ncbi:MAG TPA: AI-2E family transporter [Chloroflexia bacterium]|nr:AI-2E family transporter [Chloroflexia bacterium]
MEDNLVMPFVVGRAVEISPVVTIFAVLAGGAIAGILGMLLAVPAAAAIKVLLDFLYPTATDTALAQARPGLKKAAREAEAAD